MTKKKKNPLVLKAFDKAGAAIKALDKNDTLKNQRRLDKAFSELNMALKKEEKRYP